ncbi:hypothetical protein C1645_835462 [Glomus cerebriforme]|uniref:Uncharacterized protein n=1 Tax=Glomus cerebriforme TaxID=658196 RepID=A0A397SHV9_9GLOM|nr:hypothetical protein C1645_835462 [Glomus cerebriforme]
MLKATGCHEITPFTKDESKYQFWSHSLNVSQDQHILTLLYSQGFLTSSPNDASSKLWGYFKNAFYKNNKGQDGHIRVLSIVANKFTHNELKEQLGISLKTITSAQSYATTNSPGCPALCKPTITRVQLLKETFDQFMTFLLDKNVTTLSSYKVDATTDLPNSKFIYREDLGGLCLICNEYGFGVFENMIDLIYEKIDGINTQNELINQLEIIKYHLRREYEKELTINTLGHV